MILSINIQNAEAQNETIPLDHFYVKRQDGSIFRKFFSKFRVGLSTGYGRTFFRHELDGFVIYQPVNAPPTISIIPTGSQAIRYSNWITDVSPNISFTEPSSFVVSSDTANIGFRGKSSAIPLKLTLQYEFLRYRVGLGYSLEYLKIGEFNPLSFADKIRTFELPQSGGLMRRYFFTGGVSFYRLNDFLFTGDVEIGDFKPGSNINLAVIKKGIYFNLGVTIERDLSEYFRVFVRPSFEFKNYSLDVAESGVLLNPNTRTIQHNMNAFYLNIGASYRLPELRKCFHRQCQAQINHAHGNREYRSRMHPIYKKQNPGYGENNKELIKYKGKNKRKLNPY